MSDTPITIHLVSSKEEALAALSPAGARWAEQNQFTAAPGQLLAIPDAEGNLGSYIFGMGEGAAINPLQAGSAPFTLPKGKYLLKGDEANADRNSLAFMLGAYQYRVHSTEAHGAELANAGSLSTEMKSLRDAAFLARDLINAPANLLGPDAFAARIREFGEAHKMTVREIAGDDLLDENFPMIHTVGRASAEAPRLLDLTWGKKSDPKLTLVGKGVTFDTGGLDIKPASAMLLMKKDMGGAANILGLAHALMANKAKVRLRVLIPVVENAISGSAFRPGDVLTSRKGLTVEIGNTDAEGRLILADALALGAEEEPDLIVDMATLTGAARVALGFDLPALFTADTALAQNLMAHGMEWGDPLWHMPLWQPYAKGMASKVADINHISSAPYAGATIAGLFLEKFTQGAKNWVHLDISGWSQEPRPARPIGGTDLGIRAAYFALKERYGIA